MKSRSHCIKGYVKNSSNPSNCYPSASPGTLESTSAQFASKRGCQFQANVFRSEKNDSWDLLFLSPLTLPHHHPSLAIFTCSKWQKAALLLSLSMFSTGHICATFNKQKVWGHPQTPSAGIKIKEKTFDLLQKVQKAILFQLPLSKAGPPENIATINLPPREFTANLATMETDCSLPLASKSPKEPSIFSHWSPDPFHSHSPALS